MPREDAETGHISGSEGSSGSIVIVNRKQVGETQRDKHQYQRQQLTGLRRWGEDVFH